MSGAVKKLKWKSRRMWARLVRASNRRRSHVFIKRSGWKVKLVINERYKNFIKLLSKLILILTIVLSFITLRRFWAIIVSLSLIAVEQLLERVIFSFTTYVVTPWPDFSLFEQANYLGAMFEFTRDNKSPATIGLMFENKEEAKQVWEFIYGWNQNNSYDLGDGNITVSAIINKKKDAFVLYIYPSPTRKIMKNLKKEIEQKKGGNKEHIFVSGQMIIGKVFRYKGSGFEQFNNHYKSGSQYFLTILAFTNGSPHTIPGVTPILKDRVKIKNYEELDRKDVEKYLTRYSVDWREGEPPPKPSEFYVK